MKKLLCALIILGTTLVAVAACSPPSVKQPLKVEIVQDTKIEITWQQPEIKDITPQVVAGANGLARVKEFEK